MISDCIYNYDYQQFVWKLLLKVLCVVLSDIAVVLLTYNYGCDSQLPLVVYSILVSFVKHSAILDFCQESLEKKHNKMDCCFSMETLNFAPLFWQSGCWIFRRKGGR